MVGQPLFPDELVGALSVTEIAWGANLSAASSSWTWFEVIPLQNPGIQYTVGRQQENNVAPPATMTFTLDNTNNDYTQYSALSSNWPNVVEGTPVRQRVVIGGTSYTLMQGRAIGFQPKFDSTGRFATVEVTVAGRLRVDSNIKVPAKSPLFRAIYPDAPLHYFPLEGAVGTLNAPSVMPNDSAILSQQSGGTLTWAGYTPEYVSPPYYIRFGTDNLPDFSKGGALYGSVPTTNASGWGIQFVNFFDGFANGNAHVNVFEWHTADGRLYRMRMSGDGAFFGTTITMAVNDTAAETTVFNDNFTVAVLREVSVIFTPSGGNTILQFYNNATLSTATITGVAFSNLRDVGINPDNTVTSVPFVLGHLQIWNTPTFPQYTQSSLLTPSELVSWANETAFTRLTRVCAEDNIALDFIGLYDDNTHMGPQFVDTIYAILTECEQTIGGWKYDGLTDGVSYMAPSQRYDQFSQFTLDGTAGELIPPLTPLPDDFLRVNRAIVTRRNGATSTYEDSTGPLGTSAVGTYERTLSPDPNYYDDSNTNARARWEVHKGTIAGFRWPTINVNIRKIASRAAAIAGMKPGYMFTVKTPLHYQPFLPPEDILLVAEGWTATLIPPYVWNITFNCSLQDTYNVWKIGDSQFGRLATEGHTLAASAVKNASSLSFSTPAGKRLFTVIPGDFPMYVLVDGIRVKVTAISGTSSPQTATVDPTTVTKALGSGKGITMWKNGVYKL